MARSLGLGADDGARWSIQEAPMAAAYANLPASVRADILRLSAVLPALLEKAGPSPAAR